MKKNELNFVFTSVFCIFLLVLTIWYFETNVTKYICAFGVPFVGIAGYKKGFYAALLTMLIFIGAASLF